MGWHNPPISWRDFEKRLSWKPGAERPDAERPDGSSGDKAGRRPQDPPEPRRDPAAVRRSGPPIPWAELHCHSSFSFLDGASEPAALAQEAARLGVEAMAITDHDGMYGAVQFAQAANELGVGTIFGAELSLGLPGPQTGEPDPAGEHLLVLARDATGYARLCSAITAAQLDGGQKGRPVYDVDKLAGAHGGHWVVLTGCRKGAVPAALSGAAGRSHGGGTQPGGPEAAERELRRLTEMFGRDNVFVELIDHDQPDDDVRNDVLFELAARTGLGAVASNNVHFAAPGPDARLAQALAAVRARRSLDDMVGWLPAGGTAHVRTGAEMAARLARFPGVRERTVELARSCIFDFDVVAPRLPDWPVPEGHDEASWLRQLVAEGALKRYGPPGRERTPGAYAQIAKELDVIENLGFPGYFLIVHDIVKACEDRNILCQGRGSAANSAVCYALGITGVDAVRHGLLFERFLSPGRDGPPDIDLDIEHRRREDIIQYVYDKYGRKCTAQVANVISYRPRMAVRDAARALGFSPGQQDAWSKGIDPRDPVGTEAEIPTAVTDLAARMLKLPRHLGIHSGGMVIADRPVGEVCPIEWATKAKRSVLQWDKDDCAAAGLVKFDLLGLGMLAALHDTFDLVAEHHGERYDLHSIPPEDPLVYDMLCDADTVGVFQVESRAQMATLPRLKPREFYDLVVEVALIRPGPIQGGSVHPYLRRRKGAEPPDCPHPLMRNALARTLGVPLFQEQMMQLAVDCAGFSPAESDLLRQAMGAKRAPERVERLRTRLLEGMAERGIPADIAEDIYEKILGFTGFGFPESHAQSFAHLVYASSWLKRHHPAAFTAALVRNQPMGFYSTQSLYADARRHGVVVRPVDINASDAHPTLEEPVPVVSDHPHAPGKPQPAIRMGLTGIRNLGDDVAEKIAAGRPYTSMEDLVRRVPLSSAALESLATAGAFSDVPSAGAFSNVPGAGDARVGRGTGVGRREALWAAGALAGVGPGQLEGVTPGAAAPALPPMTPVEETLADLWATGVSHTHPMAHVREALDELGALSSTRLAAVPGETNVVVAGLVTHRQRPPTAGGIVFMTLEDETGIINVTCPPQVFQRHRGLAVDSQALLVNGRLEKADGVTSVRATRLRRLPVPGKVKSRNFH
ncbi:error-prone DNA polymerase [Actinomadura rudentiformis]|uniref:Error-prone DNA polymerase n=1 Tax=Actinomadura rudentiformis TaxID=359158 RepID=A0A6H9YFP5_9ACTN|nr:error-prone DNA polymerase [Actinomadura rudentiformis]KAB2344378.1 error-prone DNA polymerase [Actinomadura rudentiformis]